MAWTSILPSLLVTWREGFEATLVVGLVLACLYKANQSYLNSWVYGGVAAGLGGSVLFGSGLTWGIEGITQAYPQYEEMIEPLLEGILGTIAIAMLSWMLLWMTQQSRSLKAEIETSLHTALTQNRQAGIAVFTLVSIAVLREGFETVVFLLSYFQEGIAPWLGGILGLALAILFGILIFQGGIKINIRLFFQIMGMILLLIIAGLVLSALAHFDSAYTQWVAFHSLTSSGCFSTASSCLLGPLVWDGSQILPDHGFPGLLLKALFGYREHLYLVQIAAYLLFLTLVGSLYFWTLYQQELPKKTLTPS